MLQPRLAHDGLLQACTEVVADIAQEAVWQELPLLGGVLYRRALLAILRREACRAAVVGWPADVQAQSTYARYLAAVGRKGPLLLLFDILRAVLGEDTPQAVGGQARLVEFALELMLGALVPLHVHVEHWLIGTVAVHEPERVGVRLDVHALPSANGVLQEPVAGQLPLLVCGNIAGRDDQPKAFRLAVDACAEQVSGGLDAPVPVLVVSPDVLDEASIHPGPDAQGVNDYVLAGVDEDPRAVLRRGMAVHIQALAVLLALEEAALREIPEDGRVLFLRRALAQREVGVVFTALCDHHVGAQAAVLLDESAVLQGPRGGIGAARQLQCGPFLLATVDVEALAAELVDDFAVVLHVPFLVSEGAGVELHGGVKALPRALVHQEPLGHHLPLLGVALRVAGPLLHLLACVARLVGVDALPGETVLELAVAGVLPPLVPRKLAVGELALVQDDFVLVLRDGGALDVQAVRLPLVLEELAFGLLRVEAWQPGRLALGNFHHPELVVARLTLGDVVVCARREELRLRTAQRVARDAEARARLQLSPDRLRKVDAAGQAQQLRPEALVDVAEAAERPGEDVDVGHPVEEVA
mmetsp:Transcript_33471/g.75872  ORF Transcript_33471/g.75872 Transcript_33471/m.75872 type:complete len:585 (-) Transcript_33471:690-2444(-)